LTEPIGFVVERNPDRLFARAAVHMERRNDGSLRLRSPTPLEGYSRCVGDWLVRWANEAPNRIFLSERSHDGQWAGVTYSEALGRVRNIGAWLLRQGLSEDRPLAILADNSIEHGLLALGAMHVGIPVVPVSPAYSLVSKDFVKLRMIIETTCPGVLYVSRRQLFNSALRAVAGTFSGIIVNSVADGVASGMTCFTELLNEQAGIRVEQAFARVNGDTVAKLLFTSGSTGSPKGVINTQRMLCVNQQQIAQVWPFLAETAPIIVDWLPWNHTFGGNHDFNLVLRFGGTLCIDEGRPAPHLFANTLANLREVSPTVYFNVPRGYSMLIPALRSDEELRRRFFRRLQLVFYAAAALPQHLWDALKVLALETTGAEVALVSAWGSTETAPLATSCHFRAERAGVIGIPVPGCELKLVPAGPKLEARVRGPQVTPGYWKQQALTAESFDEEGFYRIGDAVRLLDEDRPELGLVFDGRMAEDFKLSTGTWVNAGAIRLRALAALGSIVQDLVVAGHDRDEIGLLLFPNPTECLNQAAVRERIQQALAALHRESTGSSTFARRALMMSEAPSVDAGEITDKGYINQGLALQRRHYLVEQLYAADPPPGVILLDVQND